MKLARSFTLTVQDSEYFDTLFNPGGPSECWEWQGSISTQGYGRVFVGDRYIGAHRFALQREVGPPANDRLLALHSCDNKPCVNPRHLRWGTPKENVVEAYERGLGIGTQKKSHCLRGHPLSGSNIRLAVIRRNGKEYQSRICKACNKR